MSIGQAIEGTSERLPLLVAADNHGAKQLPHSDEHATDNVTNYRSVVLSKSLALGPVLEGRGEVEEIFELGRRVDGTQLFGLTTPLITTADGGKMGKTVSGAVWLNADALAPYDYWQFWRNTQDADVGRFLKLFTDLPLDEIARLEALEGSEINEAKKILADAATAMLHGRQAAEMAAQTARDTFESGGAGDDLPPDGGCQRHLCQRAEAAGAPEEPDESDQLAGAGERDGKAVLTVDRARAFLRVVRQLVPRVLVPSHVVGRQPVASEPRLARVDPLVVQGLVGGTAINGWLASPAHRDTLLSTKFQEFGLAVATVGE